MAPIVVPSRSYSSCLSSSRAFLLNFAITANVAITVAKPGELSALPAAKRIAMRTPQFPDGTNP